MNEKVALASCNGMSPNGLVSRVAVGDAKKEDENIISICMGSTSADIKGENNAMLKKYPIISINGCNGECVNKILENRNIKVKKSINVGKVLENYEVRAKDPFRLDVESEECVKIIKNKILSEVDEIID
ncbi:putative zinc-binding protein [Methanobrevibacter sp.]|uniref:putative zinc-binding protein n=1 Tax=Methanobrevibacter sp. TaxID=66852 RepID=UPI00388F3B1F